MLDRVERDHLAVGLTRPAMVFGVAKILVFVNLITTVIFCLNLHAFFPILFGIFFHGIAFWQSQKEPLFYKLWWKWISLTPPVPNFKYWGKQNSYSPR